MNEFKGTDEFPPDALGKDEPEQRSDEWRQQRLGKVTASRLHEVIARTKTGWGASRANYMSDLIIERLTGVPTEGYTSAAMRFGTEMEPRACAAYAFFTDTDLTPVGFVQHPTIEMAGASPDQLIYDDGVLEVKVPNSATHLDTLLTKTIPGKYLGQIHWQLACTGRQWGDYVSYDPRMPARFQLFIKRVYRDDLLLECLEKDVRDFLKEIDKIMEKLNA